MKEIKKIKKISNRHENLIQLAVLGYSNKAIADKLGFTPQHVAKLMRDESIQNRIGLIRDINFNNVLRDRIKNICGVATEALEEVISSSEESAAARVSASKFIIEQTIGRPKSQIEYSNKKQKAPKSFSKKLIAKIDNGN